MSLSRAQLHPRKVVNTAVVAALIVALTSIFAVVAIPARASIDGGDGSASPSPSATPTVTPEPSSEPTPSVTPQPSVSTSPTGDPEPESLTKGAETYSLLSVGPSVTVSQVEDLEDGTVVTVTGTGFVESAPDTTGTRPPLAGKFGGVYVAFGRYADIWQPSANAPSSTRSNGDVKWVMNPEDAAPLAAMGAVAINPDGSFEVEITVDSGFEANPGSGNYGIYTYSGSGAKYAGFETFTPLDFVPTIEVSQTTNLSDGDVVTVTGQHFDPEPPATTGTRPPLAGKFGGVYVAFGRYADVWQPSLNAASSTRKNGDVKWLMNAEDATPLATMGAVAINPDGSFQVDLTVDSGFEENPGSGNYGIFTYAGSGAKFADFETFTPLDFVPTVEVSKTTGLDDQEQVTVVGRHFDAEPPATTGTRPPLLGKFGGTYVAFGRYADVWQPSADAPSSIRKNGDVKWVMNAEDAGPLAAMGAVAINSDGSFEVSIDVDKNFDANPGTGNYGIYTYSGSGAKFAGFETFTPVDFTSDIPVEETEPEPQPTPPTVPTPAGRLTWGVASDFRAYVTGPIAKGSISTTGSSYSGSSFTFIQSGGNANVDSWTGTANYGGSVNFFGHSGALDLTMSSPSVRLTGPGTGMLVLTVNGQRVDFASVNLGAATRTSQDGAVRFAGAPTTLTAAGAVAFDGFYSAGRALDPVTVTFGSAVAGAGGGKTVLVASTPESGALPSAPPATEGIVLDDETLAKLLAGETVTITVGGFRPGEQGIRVVIYSTPTLLGTVAADSNGVASWTGSLPSGFTGEHTLVFIGSVSQGIELSIPATVPGMCVVESESLEWGFKEAFRAYLDSTIANGSWELDGVADEEGQFIWSDGLGSLDQGPLGSVSYEGSVRFMGHEGVLDTTVSHPVIEFSADGTYVLLDVSGETQQGAAVAAQGVRFAQLDLAAGTLSEDNGVVTFADVPATLTLDGANAFGTYPEGEALDPVTFTLASEDDCVLVAVGLADAADPSVEPSASPSEAPVEDSSEDSGFPTWLLWTIVAAVLAAAAVAGVAFYRKN